MSSPIARLPDDVLNDVFSFVAGPGRHYQSIAATSQHFRDVHCSDSPILLLSDDLLGKCFDFVGKGEYRFVAGTCRRFHQVYVSEDDQGVMAREKKTTWDNLMLSVARAEFCIQDASKRQEDERQRGRMLFRHRQDNLADAFGGDLDFYHERKRQYDLRDIFKAAVKAGSVDFLNWTLNQGYVLEEYLRDGAAYFYFSPAIEKGHVNVLEWADAHNLEWFDAKLSAWRAAKFGRISVLDYISQKHKRPNEDVMRAAAFYGQIGVLRWIKKRNMLSVHCSSLPYVLQAHVFFIAVSTFDWLRAVASGAPEIVPTMIVTESVAICLRFSIYWLFAIAIVLTFQFSISALMYTLEGLVKMFLL